jgi:DNA mismatch repair protein MutL
MTSKIRLLDEQTINKIAAGEVVENPASVVKELIENALDAGSTELIIEIKTGGRYLIRISDNGFGMSADDGILCLERHATSKIKKIGDVNCLGTMGFRGEAIPSIAAVSKFTLMTTPEGCGENGSMVVVEGGRLLHQGSVVRSRGTTVEVKSLFFNVPARKKFQKSVSIDVSNVHKTVIAQALSHPGVGFKLLSDNKAILSCVAADFKTRIFDVLGQDFIDNMRPLDHEEEGVVLKGFIGEPVYTRPNRTGQYLFINKRFVSPGSISKWVNEGYGMRLATNRHPVFVLQLELSGDNVDVNVHPQKREVRFRNGILLRDIIARAVDKALGAVPRVAAVQQPETKPVFQKVWTGNLFKEELQKAREVEPPPEIFEGVKTTPCVVSTIKNYILTKDGDHFMVLDQHAAHARIIFEQLQQKGSNIASQSLLVPYAFDVTTSEAGFLNECLDEINALGISLRAIGSNTFMVDAIPRVVEKCDVRSLVLEILEELQAGGDARVVSVEMDKKIATAASRMALNTNTFLDVHQAQGLVDSLFKCQSPEYAPNGSPVILILSSEILDQMFAEKEKKYVP